MKKLETYLIVILVLVCCQFLVTTSLHSQTKTTLPDTTKKPTQKLEPKEEKPKLELPDVLIYGTDRSVRVTGDKLEKSQEDAKLIAPTINYEPLKKDLNLENNKNYFDSQEKSLGARTLVQLDVGKYQQFNFKAGQWEEKQNYNYSIFGKYDRSNGQYDNSQYYQGAIQGQFGFRVSPNFVISTQGKFRLYDYGLYGAEIENLRRKKSGGKIKIDAQWSISAEQSADFSIYFQQNNCIDKDGIDYSSKLEQRGIGLVSLYQTKYRSIPIFVRSLYEYQRLDQFIADSIRTQNYFQLKSWTSFKIKNYLIIKPTILFENLDVNDSLSQYLVSPDIEIIAMSTPKFGVLLKASREYLPINYTEICEKNPFISSKTNFVPMKKEMELKLGIEYKFSSQLSLNGEIIRQSWKKYAYWYREPKIGLFQLNSLNKATLTILNFQSKFTFSSKLNVDAGIQINFDSSKDDSVTNHLPYLERFRIPFNLEYKIDKTTQASLTIQLIGPRYADLKNNEKLSSIGLLSVYLEKQLIKNISVFVEGNNLTNQKYEIWQKYPSMGFYFGAGLRGSW
jgi:hypothetical protein